MAESTSHALVPLKRALPARRAEPDTRRAEPAAQAFDLVSQATVLEDRAQVERFLPDILGRALARAWIDTGFRRAFGLDPKGTLAAHRIRLPDSIGIEVVTEGQTRPMVIVSERATPHAPARRLIYLQLVMVAGK